MSAIQFACYRSGRESPLGRITLAFGVVLAVAVLAFAATLLVQLSTDPFTNTDSQHDTEVEPDTYAFGSTIVTAFQVGRRFTGGGASDIGFATSTNGGVSWSNGFLPGITVYEGGGTFPAASDPAVAYDAAHGAWMISSLGVNTSNNWVLVSRSTDGGITWNSPATVDKKSSFADKEWIACDNNSSSPFYGHCYVEWDDAGVGDRIKMSTSTDGGLTWGAANTTANAFGLGGQPVVQPNGTVVVPFEGFDFGFDIEAITSTNGGTTWTRPVAISAISDHTVATGFRTSPLPSAEVDAAGTVYVVWQDCRFRTGCSSNDMVMSTSSNGTTWTAVTRIPIDSTTSTVDHFIPGLAVDHTTSGSRAHLALTYYYFPVANCTTSTCKLFVGFVSSQDGGTTWRAPRPLTSNMTVSSVANTDQGRMVGDYVSTSYVNGKAFGVFADATSPTGTTFHEAMDTTARGLQDLEAGPLLSSAGERPVPNAHPDHGPRKFYDLEGRIPIPPSEQR